MTDSAAAAARHLRITLCEDIEEAIALGFDWSKQYVPVEVKDVVVVKSNMFSGRPATVEFVLQDVSGQCYVFMLTREMLQRIPG